MSYEPNGWIPSPRHLLRVGCIADVTADWEPGSVFEVGAGTGDVTSRFIDRGFSVTAHDLGHESRRILRERFGSRITVVDNPDDVAPASVDYLFAFEVLEHIVDDLEALRGWVSHLRPGGRVLLSVPAHQRKYGDTDRAVGHVRRYEREQLMALLVDAGLREGQLHNYGFPVGNALRWTQTGLRVLTRNRATEATTESDRVTRTVTSGVKTAAPLNRIHRLSKPQVMRPFAAVQRLAYSRDWSDGYVATAIRPSV